MDLSHFAEIDKSAYNPKTAAAVSERFHAIINQRITVEILAITQNDQSHHTVCVRELADACFAPEDFHSSPAKSETYYRLDTEEQCRDFLKELMSVWEYDPNA